jgi:hypothetical protein
MKTLLHVYKHAQDMGATSVDFRDAIVDAVAEVLNDWGLIYYLPWELLHTITEGIEERAIRHLVAFYYVLIRYPPHVPRKYGRSAYENEIFERCRRDKYENLEGQNGRTNREIWENYLIGGRCAFHEHADGRCRRVKSASAVQVPQTSNAMELHSFTDAFVATSQKQVKL